MAVATGNAADNIYLEDDEEEEEYDDEEIEDDEDDEDDESCSDQSSTTSTSTSNNQRVDGGRVCDCCYCEVFGHGMPAVAPTSRNYNEMRERLRSRLNKRKAEKGRCENRSNVSAMSHDKRKELVDKEDSRDLEELLNFIEGTTSRDNVNVNKPGKTKKKKEKPKKKKEKQKDKKPSSNIMTSSMESEASSLNQSDSKTNVLKCNLSDSPSSKLNNKENYSNISKEDKTTQVIYNSTPSGSHNLSPRVERSKERKSNQIDQNSCRNTSNTIANDSKVNCNHSNSTSNIKKSKEEKRRNGDETKSDKNQIVYPVYSSTDSHEGQQPTHQISQEKHNHFRCSPSTPTSLINHERSLSHGSINTSTTTNDSSTTRTMTTTMSKVASSTTTVLCPPRASSPPPTRLTANPKSEPTSKSSLTLSLNTSSTTTITSSSSSRSSSSSTTKTSSTTSNDFSNHSVNSSTALSSRSKNGQKCSHNPGPNNASSKKSQQHRPKESTIPSSDKKNCLNLSIHNSCSPQLIEESLSASPKNSKRRDKREGKSRHKNKISDDILSPDEVFKPKDIDLENDELDETEKEVEAFKRFCYNSVTLARKDKINVTVDLTGILVKKSPKLAIKKPVKSETGK